MVTRGVTCVQSITKCSVCKKKLLTDFAHLVKFSHTGNLEVHHAVVNKYAPKRWHFSYLGMICRTQLAAMDHNAGVFMEQTKTKDGMMRSKLVFPKQSSNWVAKPIKTHKNKDYVVEMVNRVVECCAQNLSLKQPTIGTLPRNIASTPRPDKSAVVELSLIHI